MNWIPKTLIVSAFTLPILGYTPLKLSAQIIIDAPAANQPVAQQRIVVGVAIAPAANNEATQAAEKALRDDMSTAVKLLEEKNYSEFFIRYMPVDQFRTLRNRKDFNDVINKAPKQDIDAFIKEMAIFKDAQVKFGPNNLTATLTIDLNSVTSQPIPLKSAPALKEAPEGYGDALKSAIVKAIKDLETPGSDEVQSAAAIRYAKAFLPLSEVAYWETTGWDRYEASRKRMLSLTRVDDVVVTKVSAIPLADLKAIEVLDPNLEADGRRAVFTLPHPKSKYPAPKSPRKIILELVEGNWRLADSAVEMKKIMEAELKNKPHSDSSTKSLILEKMGTTWRFTPQSFR